MELREKIIKEMVGEEIESYDVIHTVIADAFKNINAATHRCSSVEISGLGTLLFSKKKGETMLREYEQRLPFLKDDYKIVHALEFIDYIKKRI